MTTLSRHSTRILVAVSLLTTVLATSVSAMPNHKMMANGGTEISTPALGGYDPVAYFEVGRPVRGNGYHTAEYRGATYLFASEDHQRKFKSNPEKYAPQYGGYCAYGVSVGKKFYSDPNRWKIVDGKLYLNLDKDIQKKWREDLHGNIAKADSNWMKIEHKHPAEL